MPITADQALSAAMRGVMKVNAAEGTRPTDQVYLAFLEEVDDAVVAAADAALVAASPEPRDEETKRMVQNLAYHRLQTLLTATLFALYHFPHYEHVDRARVGEDEAVDG